MANGPDSLLEEAAGGGNGNGRRLEVRLAGGLIKVV